MSYKLTSKSIVAVVLAALLVVGAAGPAFAATSSIDSETSDTSTESDITADSTIDHFTANESNSTWVEVSFDSAPSGEARMSILDASTADDNEDMEAVYTNTSAEETNATSNNYAWNITHDELDDVPIGASENKTFVLKTWDSEDTSNATYTEFNINSTTDDRAVYRVGDSLADSNDVEISDKHPILGDYLDSYDLDSSTAEFDDVGTSDNTTHKVVLSNGTVADTYAEAADEREDGEWMTEAFVVAENEEGDDMYLPLFVNEANEDWDYLDDDEAYAVYNTDDDTIEVMYNGDEAFDGATETSITAYGNSDLSFTNAYSMMQELDAGASSAAWNAASTAI